MEVAGHPPQGGHARCKVKARTRATVRALGSLEAQVGTTNALRVVVLVFGGLVMAGALIAGSFVYLASAIQTGEAISSADRACLVLIGGFSLVIAAAGLVAAGRVRSGLADGEHLVWLARIAPLLLVAGAIGGAAIMSAITRGHVRELHDSAQALCKQAGRGDARCEPIALRCISEARATDSVRGVHVEYDDPLLRPDAVCLRARLSR